MGRDDGAPDSILSTVPFQQKHGFGIKKSLDSMTPPLVAWLILQMMNICREAFPTANAVKQFGI